MDFQAAEADCVDSAKKDVASQLSVRKSLVYEVHVKLSYIEMGNADDTNGYYGPNNGYIYTLYHFIATVCCKKRYSRPIARVASD